MSLPPTSRTTPSPIPPETISHLLTTAPWTRPILTNPQKYIPIKTPSREPKSTGEDTFISTTLATKDTFPIYQPFYTLPDNSPDKSPDNLNININIKDKDKSSKPNNNNNEDYEPPQTHPTLTVLITIGTALNGHPNTLHGGALSVLFDEILGHIAILHSTTQKPMYTAFLNTTFLRPVKTPGTVVGRAWLVRERSGGRKFWVRGRIEDGVGGEGGVLARGEALLVVVRERL